MANNYKENTRLVGKRDAALLAKANSGEILKFRYRQVSSSSQLPL